MAIKKATKKAFKKASTKAQPTSSTAAATMIAAAPTATAADAKSDTIFGCIVSEFGEAGLPHISAPDVKIVWSKFIDPPDILDQLGNSIRDCIIGKGFQCQGLVGMFIQLRDGNKVTPVSTLVKLIALVVG